MNMHFRAISGNKNKPNGLMRLDRRLFIVILFVVLGLIISLIVGTDLKREYDNEIAAASSRTQNLTKILEGYTQQSMRRVEFHLSQAARQVNALTGTGLTAQQGMRQRISALLPADGLMRDFAVIDAKGTIIASTSVANAQGLPSVADRDYFVSQLERPSSKLFIGAATLGRNSGQWIIPVSVALIDANGAFQGVLLGTLDPAYFQRFYDTIDTGSNGFVTLFTRQGTIAARSPFVESMLQRSWAGSPMFSEHLPTAPVKTVRQVVAADGIERLYSYRALNEYPLVVSMGVSLTDSLVPWRVRAKSEGTLLAMLLAGLALTAYILVHQQQERLHSSKRLQDSEVRRNAATDSGRVAIWEVDLTTKQLTWDDNCFALYRISKSDFSGKFEEWSKSIYPQDLDAVILAFQNAVAGTGQYHLTFRIVWPTGEIRHIEAHGQILKDPDGEARRMVGTNWDITDQKLNEQELKASVRDKEALLKEVHHRVKNNLQVITSLLRMEANRSLVADTKEVLGYMSGRIRTMGQLHESLYRSGTFASVDLGVYLRQVATQAFKSQELHRDAVRLTLNLGSVQSGMDQAQAAGLLLNELISNCLKHGFPGGRTGEVSVELKPANDQAPPLDVRWCLRVGDTGVGLAPDFEDKRKASLGLQLVTDLSHQLGGTFEIDSVPGAGAQFKIVFAVQAPAALVMPP